MEIYSQVLPRQLSWSVWFATVVCCCSLLPISSNLFTLNTNLSSTNIYLNADVVALASYAPLFVNVNARQWNPDAIQFNSSAIANTPSYYVQQLFMKYLGKAVAQTTLTGRITIMITSHSTRHYLHLQYRNSSHAASNTSKELSTHNLQASPLVSLPLAPLTALLAMSTYLL